MTDYNFGDIVLVPFHSPIIQSVERGKRIAVEYSFSLDDTKL